MTTKYFDKDMNEISADRYKELAADDSYRIVHAFENEKVRQIILWTGAIKDADTTFRTTYPLFTVEQYDKVGDKWIEAPEFGKTFANKRKMEAFYEDFVLSWTESYIDDENGELVEIGNVLAPPEPVKPSSAPQGNYDEMVW